ncbi:unnamed protein product [Rotaria sp. Silwood1]|nr:unnamed protein product [Rotaria sp. Silwood1]CAF0964381.1 unnamed protein product [Rotaria sp. Silwood1]CAF0973678.1 unnamed protein product [Rotaria sp. Silwood1]CAF3380902.1 unnamed protein product [Rotaria sp. Silwood1]CAF3404991.1 unnamed protein product [Rotaria sp. Silwood1]
MLAVASLKRSLEFDPVEQGVKRKRAEIKLSPTTFAINNTSSSSSTKQQSIFTKSSTNKKSSLKSCSLTALTSSSTDDIPMFTYTQTAQMCARFLREQDKLIREQYEQLLTTKLNEQYEQFVRYSHDSVYKNSSKQQLFHFGQQQETENTASTAFSYVL